MCVCVIFPTNVLKWLLTPHQFPCIAGKVCKCFLLVKYKDSHLHFTNCCGKSCTAVDHCADCHDWTGEKWIRLVFIMKS